ncbi:hypothetical protein RQP46_001190 [Phenoliferia psychrophenolica]
MAEREVKPVKKASKPQAQFSISTFMPKLNPGSPMPTSTPPARSAPSSSTAAASSSKLRAAPSQKPTVKGKEKALKQDDAERSNLQWVDRYEPTCREDLGVHAKKVQDVANWLDEAYNPKLAKYRRILVMSGPSGAAKTATLRILAEENDIELVEYRNGNNLSFAGDYSRESMVNQFHNFLSRAGMAPALELCGDPDVPLSIPSTSSSASQLPTTPTTKPGGKRLILIEDLPNTSHYQTKLAFRSALQQYLASPRVTCPMVVIVSEALSRPGVGEGAESTNGDGRMDESVDARSVCGIDVLQAPGCREIKFNSVAVTIMKKALIKILDRAYSSSSSHATGSRPSVSTLEIIIAHSNGDIRSALMSLEFLASNPAARGVTSLAGGVGAAKKGKKRTSDGKVKSASGDEVKKLLQFVTARESSLFIFHALGKVLYSKRWTLSADDDKKDTDRQGVAPLKVLDKLPKHLRKQWARAPSKVNPDVMFAEAPVDSDIFLSYIHHNYTAFTNDIDECAGIMEKMSDADSLMRMEGEEWLRRAALTSQYSFNVAVRGTLLNLSSPVPKRSQVLRKSEMWDKMRLTRANEAGLEDMYRRREGLAIVPPWEGDGRDILGGSQRSRRSLTTEFVPYLGGIQKARKAGSKFLMELATFPPVQSSAFKAAVRGEALGEKDVEEMDEAEAEEDGEDSDLEIVEEEVVMEEEQLYDPDDDIED